MRRLTTTLLLIRHGQTASNVNGYFMGWNDVRLNEPGQAQSERLAKRLASQPIAAIYTSPLRRAFETAETIGKPHGLRPVPMPDLMEMNYGDWQGLKRAEIIEKYPELWRKAAQVDPEMRYPGGESYTELMERSVRAFKKIAAAGEGKLVAAVSHQGFLRSMVMHVLDASFSICPRIEFGNTSLSVVKITNGIPRLVTLNDIAHLENLNRANS